MPVSSSENKEIAKRWIEAIDAQNIVVDIGAGVGTYKTLLESTKARWIGIEIFAPYITEYNLKDIYEDIF